MLLANGIISTSRRFAGKVGHSLAGDPVSGIIFSPEQTRLKEEREYEIRFGQNDLGADIDWKSFPEDEFWVLGKTALPPAIKVDENGQVLRFTLLPLREFRLRHRGERANVIPILWWMTNRIRNYVAYFCRSPIPVGFRLLGRSLVVPKAADFSSILEVPASLIEDYLFDRATDEEMSRKLGAMYDETQHFLSVVKTDTFLDRSIVNAGDAYWARNPMDGFLQSWKAVEAIADMDFLSARTVYEATLVERMSRYLEPKELERIKVKAGSVPKPARIEAAVGQRAPQHVAIIQDLQRLRNAIAHGEVTSEKFGTILTRRNEIASVARALIQSALREHTDDSSPKTTE